jgi:putative DNA methylase
MTNTFYRKKLIDISLPLEAINDASVAEKFIRSGHPSVLHQWWSRKPLVTARAVLFASLVDDPSEYLTDDDKIIKERERLLKLLSQLAKWENSNNQIVLDQTRLEIARSLARQKGLPTPIGRNAILDFLAAQAPVVLDPFAGGGSIPLEAQRLGLTSQSSDLNPIAVLINKAMVEIPARFSERPPVHPKVGSTQMVLGKPLNGIHGLLDDFQYYGNWVQDQAEKKLAHLYPKIKLPPERGTGEATVVAWIWAHVIRCPNPACGSEMPLASKWELSQKKGRETWVKPIVDRSTQPAKVLYTIVSGKGEMPEGTVDRRGAKCIVCGTTVPLEHIRQEAMDGRMSNTIIAIAAEAKGGRIYSEPDEHQIKAARSAQPPWKPEQLINEGLAGNVTAYGCKTFGDLFMPRQLVALTTLADLIREVRSVIETDAISAGFSNDKKHLSAGGNGALAYAEAIVTYLAFAFSKTLNRSNAFVPWGIAVECPVNLFSRQTIAFIWDFAESNVIFGPSGSFRSMLGTTIGALETIDLDIPRRGDARQIDAASAGQGLRQIMISTDPPYYDVISYADLSDFFYVWLRPLLGDIYPDLFATMLTPKSQELIADATRSGGKEEAKVQFEQGMFNVFSHFKNIIDPTFPLTVYYAYKQTEKRGTDQKISTGWETILSGMINGGFVITGTWPMRTERAVKVASLDANVLASSIVLVCRPRPKDAETIKRRDFLLALKRELPLALKLLKQGNIPPVDMAQAAIGPGMAIYSRYNQVLETDGTSMPVRTALSLINQSLDEYMAEQEGDYDSDTRWALSWFEQFGYDEGAYGVAETLSKAKNISIQGLVESGILEARSGKVRLFRRNELKPDWDPKADTRLTVWETTQYLIQALDKGGELTAAHLLVKLGLTAESARDLAYRLYGICERKKWAQEAILCNMLVVAWPRLKDLSAQSPKTKQVAMF